jgi:Homeodomain-like domain
LTQLEARYRAARDVTEARHYQAIGLLAQGRTVAEVAAVLGFVPRWAEQLARRSNAQGPAALGDQRRQNPPDRGIPVGDTPGAGRLEKTGSPEPWRGPGPPIRGSGSRSGPSTSTASA